MKSRFSTGWTRAWLAALAMTAAAQSLAVDRVITAQFIPSVDDPTSNMFTNTTTSGLFCRNRPALCDDKRSLPGVAIITNTGTFLAHDPNPRNGFMIRLPADWRDIQVRHQGTGESRTVQLRFTGFFAQLVTTRMPV